VANTVIDSKTINCDIDVRTTGVVIRRSHVNGNVTGPEGPGTSFRVEDSFVDGSPNGPRADRSIGYDNFVVLRSEIVGGQGEVYCRRNCTVQDSWMHGQDLADGYHASAVRVEQGSTLIHNTIACDWMFANDATDTGCSADQTGYPDFAPINHNTMSGNLYIANVTDTGFCAYGGGTAGKPYSGDPTNATYVVFTNNVFQRGGPGKKCGAYGPIADFIPGRTGNVWTNNRYDDGTLVPPT
jgi:hypothetical protein